MKKITIILIILCITHFIYAQDLTSEKSIISTRWLSQNFGGYNLPLPLKVKLSEDVDNTSKIRIKADAFIHTFPVNSSEMTLWIEYPRGASEIVCELVSETSEVISTKKISVPLREIRDTDQRLTGIISDKEVFYNARYANFLLKEQEMPVNWYKLTALDEIIIIDYQRLKLSQINALKNYVECGGVLILPENFTNSDDVINQLNIDINKIDRVNELETLGNRNHIILRSVSQYGLGVIIKYKISDDLELSDELEIIRKNLKKVKIPWTYKFLKSIPESVDLSKTQYFEIMADEKLSKTVQIISLAILITLLILIVGMRYLKRLSNTERLAYISIFCVILTLAILLMQGLNSLNTSSVVVTFTDTNDGKTSNFNTEIKMIKFNHAGKYEFPTKSNFIKIVSADFQKFNENADVSFESESFTVNISNQTTLFIAIINTDTVKKTLSVTKNSEKFIASNLSDQKLERLTYINSFVGSEPVDMDKFSSISTTEAQTPYRDIFSKIHETKNPENKMFAVFSRNMVNHDREFVTCFRDGSGNNLQIIVSPIINQK